MAYYIWHMDLSLWQNVLQTFMKTYDVDFWPQGQIYRDLTSYLGHTFFILWYSHTIFSTWVYHHGTTYQLHPLPLYDLDFSLQYQLYFSTWLCLGKIVFARWHIHGGWMAERWISVAFHSPFSDHSVDWWQAHFSILSVNLFICWIIKLCAARTRVVRIKETERSIKRYTSIT